MKLSKNIFFSKTKLGKQMCYPRNKPRTVKLLSERRGTKLGQQKYYPCKSDSADGTVEKQLKHLRKVKMFRRTISREINLQYNSYNSITTRILLGTKTHVRSYTSTVDTTLSPV